MEEKEFQILLKKYRAGIASKEEVEFLHSYYNLFETEDDITAHMSDDQKESIRRSIKGEIARSIKAVKLESLQRRIRFFAASAAIFLILSGLSFYFYKAQEAINTSTPDMPVKLADIAPGGNRAVLTLSDGSTIVLDNAPNGTLARQGRSHVRKTKDGTVEYHTLERVSLEHRNHSTDLYNTITTPRGGQYHLSLPDGSGVWLNAASSIRFPTEFAANERRVEITGEVYFEVTADRSKPFRVTSGQQEIEVLGTHFNINAYDDEPSIKTTLLEGSVRVKLAKDGVVQSKLLRPGEQAQIERGEAKTAIKVLKANTEEAVAWKNGYFMFYRAGIQNIMRQVARWYSAEVVFEGRVPSDEFVGKIKRTENVSGVLRVLELGEVKFRVEGRKIIIGQN